MQATQYIEYTPTYPGCSSTGIVVKIKRKIRGSSWFGTGRRELIGVDYQRIVCSTDRLLKSPRLTREDGFTLEGAHFMVKQTFERKTDTIR